MTEMHRDLIEAEAVRFLGHLVDQGATVDDAIDIAVVFIAHVLGSMPDLQEAERRAKQAWSAVALNLNVARAHRGQTEGTIQ